MTFFSPASTAQVQAAIKKKVEKQKKRSSEPGAAAGDAHAHAPQPGRHPRAAHLPQTMTAEDRESLEERLQEMMEGPHRRDKEGEGEEEEPVDLMPIVDSVFGQVGPGCCSRGSMSGRRPCACVRVCVCLCVYSCAVASGSPAD